MHATNATPAFLSTLAELERQCHGCGVGGHWQLCANCELRLSTACPQCGHPLPPVGSRRCGHCGLHLPWDDEHREVRP